MEGEFSELFTRQFNNEKEREGGKKTNYVTGPEEWIGFELCFILSAQGQTFISLMNPSVDGWIFSTR